jgi:hypothetical protein
LLRRDLRRLAFASSASGDERDGNTESETAGRKYATHERPLTAFSAARK